MARKQPTAETYKLLFIRSGNQCAFPECDHPIFDDDDEYVAELCHINSANEGGQRFDSSQTDEDRRSFDNLMFMCHRHHKKTDNVEKYPTEKLQSMKQAHEAQYIESGRNASKEMIGQIIEEVRCFWKQQAEKEFDVEEIKIKMDIDLDIFQLISRLSDDIKRIEESLQMSAKSDKELENDLISLCSEVGLDHSKFNSVPYYENPFINRNWEMNNLGYPNFLQHLYLHFNQLKVKIIDQLVEKEPNNKKFIEIAKTFRKELDELYDSVYYVD